MQSEEKYTIYQHTCLITGKSYIGQTKNLKNRTRAHRQQSSACIAFRNAIQKYGWTNFSTKILAQNLTLTEANKLESKYIVDYNTLTPSGYNLTTGGLNHICLESTKQKISKSNLGKHNQPKSEETKKKLSTSLKGRKKPIRSKLHRLALSVASKTSIKNIQHLHEMQLARIGTFHSDETKRRLSLKRKGMSHSEATKMKMSLSHTGKHYTKIKCPYCFKEGNKTAMYRWHFSNCKNVLESK